MRVLILQDDFPPRSLGGAGVIAFRQALALQSLGHEVSVATAVQDKEESGEEDMEGIKVFKIYSNYHERWGGYLGLYNPQTDKCLKEIINRVRPDVVHAHNIHRHLSYNALKISKKSGAKVFLTAHDVMLFHYGKLVEFIGQGIDSCEMPNYRVSAWQQMRKFKKRYNPFRNIIIKKYINGIDGIFAVSRALQQALEQNGIKGVQVIHNGIDSSRFNISDHDLSIFKQRFMLDGKKIILFGGRLSEAKGGEIAIKILSLIAQKIPGTVLLVIGSEGSYGEEMKRKASEIGYGDKLIFTGWVDKADLSASFVASDLVIVPSICFDSFPTVILEAMASGRPVVATCFGGAREMVEDGVTGYIVNPYDIKSFSEKTIEILLNSKLAHSLGTAGKERVESNFSEKEWVEKIIAFYQK